MIDEHRVTGVATSRAPLPCTESESIRMTPLSTLADRIISSVDYDLLHPAGSDSFRVGFRGNDPWGTMADDFSASVVGAGSASITSPALGSVDFARDVDWFRVELFEGRHYEIGIEGSATGSGSLVDPLLLEIYDSSGNPIPGTRDDDHGVGLNSLLGFTPAASGSYYIAAAGFPEETGTYKVRVTVSGPNDDFAANMSTQAYIPVGARVRGAVEQIGDLDWFAFDLVAGQSYQFDLTNSYVPGSGLEDPGIYGLFTADGSPVLRTEDNNHGGDLNARLVYTPPASGRYYISVGAAEGVGTYALSLLQQGIETFDDYASDNSTTASITLGGSELGAVELPEDVDWFRIELVEGEHYEILIEGSFDDRGTHGMPFLSGLFDASGAPLPAGAYSARDGVLIGPIKFLFTPANTGTYYVGASGRGDSSIFIAPTGIYTVSLSIAEVAEDDYAASIDTLGVLSFDGSATAVIEQAEDRDWFAVELLRGHLYEINLRNSGSEEGLEDPFIHGIYRQDGTRIEGTTDDDSGGSRNSRLVFLSEESGRFYVSAGGFGAETGSYVLSLKDRTDDFAADVSTLGTIAIGGTASGDIEDIGDEDWFRVELIGGERYEIGVEGAPTQGGSLEDAVLVGIYDAAGNLIPSTFDDDGGVDENSLLQFTPVSSGTHYIAAGGFFTPFFGETGSYTVRLTQNQSPQRVTGEAPPQADEWLLMAPDGFRGSVGGWGKVFGTDGVQDIAVMDGAGTVSLDPSFNRGGDTLRLSGNAGDWRVSRVGSSAIFTDGDTIVQIPAGTVGLAIQFDDGMRILRIDRSAGGLAIGDQSIGAVAGRVAALGDDSTQPIVSEDSTVARLILSEGATVRVAGNIEILGTAGSEQIYLGDGEFTFDPSFNRGGDTIFFDQSASAFAARLSGSSLWLDGTGTDALMPVGSAGASLSFADGGDRSLFFDLSDGLVRIGPDIIGDDLTMLSALSA